VAKVLDVPYRSQWDDDANKSTADCGPACLAMVLGYYGVQVSVNELFSATGVAPGRYTGFGQLQRVARDYGVTFNYQDGRSLNDLKLWIDRDKPVIALVKYSYWSQIEPLVSTQDTFSGPHFVVIVGYGDGNIYINDPNYWPPRRQEGRNKAWSEVLFNLAWSNVRTAAAPNPNNAVIVPAADRASGGSPAPGTGTASQVIEYTVRPGDTWSGLAGKFYGDQSRYPEILAFNNLSAGAPLYAGLKLRIPVRQETGEGVPDQTIVLGEGARQTIDADAVKSLREKWVREGKLSATADEPAVLRAFVQEIERWDAGKVTAIEYIVQPGDTWAGIAGNFYGNQMRYREIMAFNQLPPGSPLFAGQRLLIPPK
jgi:uncharacterized protein YvpB/LysM repeat protein